MHQDSICLAVASRSPVEAAGTGILEALDLLQIFCCLEIHRGSKATHFEVLADNMYYDIILCTDLVFAGHSALDG